MSTRASAWVILIRLMVGAVFLSEGIQKFLYPAELGPGRFEKIGIVAPEVMGYVVAVCEVTAGTLILLGLLTRPAAMVTLCIITVAIISTKVPILLGEGFWGFSLREMPRYGFWSMAHEIRTDWSMLLGSLFLVIVGGGRLSIDSYASGLTRTGVRMEA